VKQYLVGIGGEWEKGVEEIDCKEEWGMADRIPYLGCCIASDVGAVYALSNCRSWKILCSSFLNLV